MAVKHPGEAMPRKFPPRYRGKRMKKLKAFPKGKQRKQR
jgi:hypothetical protein